MAMSPKMEFRQSQSLVMTPQLMQAIKLLQLSNLELVAYVEAELERNPLLERASEPESPEHDPPNPQEEAPTPPDSGAPVSGDWMESDMGSSREAIETRLDTDLGNVFPDDAPAERIGAGSGSGSSIEWGSGGDRGEDYNPEAFLAAETTLADHLEAQLSVAEPDPARRLIGLNLIGLIDETGYFSGDLDAVAEQLGATHDQVADVLRVIQSFEPSGVGARSLSECLALQLRDKDRCDPAMQALLDNLELLARHDRNALKRICGVDAEDLADMIGEIRRLDPKPGLAYGGGVVHPLVPDVFVREGSDGSWIVELNSETLPRVLVNQTYHATVAKAARSAEEKTFLADCLQSASWLTRSLDQRARTILKVASEIVRQQDAFLVHGVRHLRPLNLRTVADAIGMHESTVSRVTSNKYISTPRGVLEMKFFFSSSIASSGGGEAHAAEAVRHRIKSLIEAESADDVLSDDTLVQKLKDDGIDIARRTVAKYRESMNIPSSVQRRREKQALRSDAAAAG
ncbi:RNA polymerase sigma-54 factor [Azorhizobium caulinodans ORS 571]|uniref:RNA polymerase sigma-54 factor n=1 Tax=Azorhizobium caulinodans (strain ATCC 43989 / DSM 5975 / JCM 20966 / LMG 6465 / NBRC 14845 / NCIMB 13405 / ORS 571) TaxID=438753 RepID=RP54_AZOC5|nr:RNA polymerase factor sigma-54 [Azorhizobium caulinodans]P33984.2 RecName: Full=RNA polymerase sigma-54 factor [Azorhizobium caulinodans ORS 571]BAF89923.1 RNA polymerase sigma-54 factor [Azorhizobium caulinodans ORS 571]